MDTILASDLHFAMLCAYGERVTCKFQVNAN
jgi:hypothetical protein